MTTKYDVGDELTLKVRVAAINTTVTGTTYTLKILANNGENLAGTHLVYAEDAVAKMARTDDWFLREDPFITKIVEKTKPLMIDDFCEWYSQKNQTT